MNIKKIVIIGVAVLAMTLGSTASAQNSGHNSDAEEALIVGSVMLSTGLSTTAVLVPVGIVITVVMAVNSSNAALENYMRDNAVAVQHDLYLGGGDSARDLAILFDIPDAQFPAFADLLFENRRELAPLVEPGGVDSRSAYEFRSVVLRHLQDSLG